MKEEPFSQLNPLAPTWYLFSSHLHPIISIHFLSLSLYILKEKREERREKREERREKREERREKREEIRDIKRGERR
jgi:hypothetical protein